MKDIRNYQLLKHNTFGIDAACKRFVEFTTESELVRLLQRERFLETGEPLLILGGGSNLLLTGDFEGTVLHSAIMGIEDISVIEGPQSDSVLLRVGSGVVWDDFVAYCVARGWNGAENLSLIPGEVGASAVQNIGAYGVEAKDLIERGIAPERIEAEGRGESQPIDTNETEEARLEEPICRHLCHLSSFTHFCAPSRLW